MSLLNLDNCEFCFCIFFDILFIMNIEDRELLEENLKYSKENNKMLKKIWRDIKYKRFFSFVYWLFIIALTLGAYYYIQPIIGKLGGSYADLSKNIGTGFENLNKINQLIPDLLKNVTK